MNGVFNIAFPRPQSTVKVDARDYGALPNFVAGPENRLACIAACSLLSDSPASYNPLVLCGPAGSGKSHLAQGMARRLAADRPDLVQCVLTGAELAQQYAHAVEAGEVDVWRHGLRQVDFFLLEDLNQLVGKQPAQRELQHTLDRLLDRRSLVLVTSRQSPRELLTLLPGLRGRLSGGLEVRLALPELAARSALLEQWSAARGIEIAKPAAKLLAEGLKGHAAELLGALTALASLSQSPEIDAAAARRFIARRQPRCVVGMRGICSLTAKHFSLRVGDLKSQSRERRFVVARNVAMHLSRSLTEQSLEQIGSFYGGRDHTTVLHGCRRTEELLHVDAVVRTAVETLHQQLAGHRRRPAE